MRLFKFSENEEHEHGKQGRRRTRVGRRCARCGTGVPRSEDETYWQSGFCDWCDHQYQKLLRE